MCVFLRPAYLCACDPGAYDVAVEVLMRQNVEGAVTRSCGASVGDGKIVALVGMVLEPTTLVRSSLGPTGQHG